jgi:hypothetical protein
MMAIAVSVATLAPSNAPMSLHGRADSLISPISVPSSTERPRLGDPRGSLAPDTVSEDDEAVVDLYGNDVTSAVAKYNLDADGSLYEAHSPQTQLPRLGSPKS